MGIFDRLASDRILVTKADGRQLGPYKAVVDQTKITCLDKNADFDPGDKITRTLPSGKEDVFYVVDATFYDGSGLSGNDDMSSWEVCTSRTKLDMSGGGGPPHSSINIHGAHNVQVGDGNQQTVNITLGAILSAVEELDASDEQKLEAKGVLRRAFEHPLLLAAIGGAAGPIFSSFQ